METRSLQVGRKQVEGSNLKTRGEKWQAAADSGDRIMIAKTQ